MSRVANLIAMAVVILVYGFFASVGTMRFRLIRAGEQHTPDPSADYYARLGEAFLQGNTYLSETPDPRLRNAKNPFDPAQRESTGAKVLWDASYHNGRYYLYWSPLPVLLFHIPIRLVTGRFPDDALAAAFFASWAFIAAALFVMTAFRDSRLPVWFYILVVGIGHIIPYSLVDVRVYEVAAITAMAMSATWAFALLRLIEERKPAAAAWMSVWLSLAIASRPPLALLLVPTFVVLFLLRSRKAVIAVLIPLVLVGCAVAAYNVVRFGDPFEFGMRYQLTWLSLKDMRPCSLCNTDDILRLANAAIHYQFWPVRVWTSFPFVEVLHAQLDPRTSINAGAEPVTGLFVVNPLVMIATAVATALAFSRQRSNSTIASVSVMAGAWLVLFGISTCRYVVDRYSLDFMLIMVVATIVCVENALESLAANGFRVQPLRACVVALCLYSLLMGILLGFEGRFLSFRRYNPGLTRAIAEFLNVGVRDASLPTPNR